MNISYEILSIAFQWICIIFLLVGIAYIAFKKSNGSKKGFKKWLKKDFSGYAIISSKICKRKDESKLPSSFMIWFFSIYIALYGLTSTRYELSLDRAENRINGVVAQLSTTNKKAFKNLIAFIPDIQKIETPLKPSLFKPVSILLSLFCTGKNEEIHVYTKEIVEVWKDSLEGVDLRYAHLEGADLRYAHLEGADLSKAHLEGAFLWETHLEGANLWEAHLEGADLRYAYLEGADLRYTHLEGADLRYAHLEGADLRNAYLEGADLRNAHLEGADLMYAHLEGAKGLTFEQLSKVKTLYQATGLDPKLEKELKEEHPHLFWSLSRKWTLQKSILV